MNELKPALIIAASIVLVGFAYIFLVARPAMIQQDCVNGFGAEHAIYPDCLARGGTLEFIEKGIVEAASN
jgi:hypothetical protein